MSRDGREVSLGLIGRGPWGRNYLHTVASVATAHIAAVAGRDWPSLIEKDGLDGVIIATPPATHAGIALAAIRAGLAVLIEKPLTMNPAEAHRILNSARTHEAVALVDHTHLFQPAWAELMKIADEAGELRAVRSRAGNRGPFRPDTPVLWDWGPHDVALCFDLVGQPPVEVGARRSEIAETASGLGETISMTLTFPNDVVADIEVSNLLDSPTRCFEAEFDSTRLVMDPTSGDVLVRVDGSGRHPVAVAATPPLTVAVETFVDMILSPAGDLRSLELGVAVVETLHRAQTTLDEPETHT